MKKRIMVTGGGGFIGAYLVRKLVDTGYDVQVLDNMTRGLPTRLSSVADKIQVIKADVREPLSYSNYLMDTDVIIHLAAVNGTDNFYNQPQLVLDVGVRGAIGIMESAKIASVPHIIFASSAEVYQTPSVVPTPETIELLIPDTLNPRYSYGGSKLISELIAFNYYADVFEKVQVFRPHNVYGPDMGYKHVIPQFIEKALAVKAGASNVLSMIGTGEETRAFCYVDDIVDGIITMMLKGRHRDIYHIGNDEEVTIGDLAGKVLNNLHLNIPVETVNGHVGGTPRRCPDISKMRSLGYDPQVDLDTGLDSTIKWYVDHGSRTAQNDLL